MSHVATLSLFNIAGETVKESKLHYVPSELVSGKTYRLGGIWWERECPHCGNVQHHHAADPTPPDVRCDTCGNIALEGETRRRHDIQPLTKVRRKCFESINAKTKDMDELIRKYGGRRRASELAPKTWAKALEKFQGDKDAAHIRGTVNRLNAAALKVATDSTVVRVVLTVL